MNMGKSFCLNKFINSISRTPEVLYVFGFCVLAYVVIKSLYLSIPNLKFHVSFNLLSFPKFDFDILVFMYIPKFRSSLLGFPFISVVV